MGSEPRATGLVVMFAVVSPLAAQATPSPERIVALARDLASEDARARRTAAQQLRLLGAHAAPAIPTLVRLLRDHQAGNAAAMRLVDIGPAAADPTAQVLTQADPGGPAFRLALSTLRRLGTRAAPATDTLANLTQHENESRRTTAIRLLGEIGEPAYPALDKGIGGSTGDLRLSFARAIGRCAIHSDSALTHLCTFATGEAIALRQIAATYLRTLPGPRHAMRDAALQRTWQQELAAADATRRQRAFDGLQRLGSDALIASTLALIARLDDDVEALRLHAATLLARTGPPVLPRLEAAFATATIEHREWITICAGYTGEPAIPFLTGRLESPDEAIRWRAANALQRLGEKALPTLLTALESASPTTLCSALEAIRLIGPEAQSALTPVRRLLEHANPTVRAAATSTCACLESHRR